MAEAESPITEAVAKMFLEHAPGQKWGARRPHTAIATGGAA